MDFTIFKNKRKELYYYEFLKENNETLHKINKYGAVICLIVQIDAVLYFDVKYSSLLYSFNIEIIGRFLLFLVSILLFIASYVKSLKNTVLYLQIYLLH
jgi:hypothetical protein